MAVLQIMKKKKGGGKKTQVHKVSFKIILLLQV